MDTYENENLGQEPCNTQPREDTEPAPRQPEAAEPYAQQPQQPEAAEPYHGAGAGRKESPFADSPYVMNHGYQNHTGGQQSAYQYSGYTNVPPVQPRANKPKKQGGKAWKTIAAVVLVVVLVAAGCGVTGLLVNNYWQQQTSMMTNVLNQKISALQEQINSSGNTGVSVSGSPVSSVEGGLTPAQVYAQNVNSVVAISNQSITTNFYGQTSQTASSGSGFIFTEDGYVVTNYHVVEGATTLTVITSDSTEYDAKLVGYDSTNDIALLKIDATGLPAVTIGSSDDLIVGDQVVAIGNPLGELTSTLTVGYVSAKDRTINTDGTLINMMQTDAAINPGNSGGPLFNMYGQVIGITTAKYSGTTSSGASIEGIGFAIPIDDVIGMIEDLQQYGYVTGAYLGVMVRNMESETYGLPVGVFVDSVTQNGSADRAGVRANDIILNLGGYDVETVTDLTRTLRKFKAGDTTTITVYRAGQELSLSITLDEKPHDTTTTTDPNASEEIPMPSDGSFEEWYDYLEPFFRGDKG